MVKRVGILLIAAALSIALAQNAREVLQSMIDTLDAGPWQARLVGKVRVPSGDLEAIEIVLKTIPKAEVARADFIKPDALADNYVVRTKDKVYNYLFVTNQVVVYPIDRAKVEGLGFDFAKGGNPKDLAEAKDLSWTLSGEEETPQGPAWHLTAKPQDPDSLGFASAELWVLKNPPRPYRMRFLDQNGEVLADITLKAWKRAAFKESDLLEFPPDAEVVRK